LTVAKLALEHKVNKFVFSSSATVYGDQPSPFHEEMNLLPATNPYGATKQMSEQILKDISFAHPEFKVTLLRYFNPIGAHESGLIGESPLGIPNNLMPYILDVALGKRPHLNVYGSDYPTLDGSGVRDYIHVMDLAEAHVVALEKAHKPVNIYNVGTGQGRSVLEVVKAFEIMNDVKIPLNITSRRPGDIAVSFADPVKIKNELGYQTKRDLNQMVKDAWNFAKGSNHA
jgi:UDP-glucose 4-epimerase